MVSMLFSCKSPERDGSKMAEEFNECAKTYLDDISKLSSRYISDFDDSNYITRAEAKKAYWDAAAKLYEEYVAEIDKLKKKEAEYNSEYGTDYEAKARFSDAFDVAIDQNLVLQVYESSLSEQLPETVSRRISSFVPTRPDNAKIQKDLVGHSIKEGVVQGYYDSDWKWTIEEGEISNFSIKEVLVETKSEYEFIAAMRLTSKIGKAFDAEVKVRYILPETDDWKIEFTKSEGMHIVKTGKYDDCIRTEKSRGWGDYTIYNDCDMLLEVGGVRYYNGEWKKFSVNVKGHCSDYFYGSDYRIEYVELP